MRCLFCGKELKKAGDPTESASQWHSRCSEIFFGSRQVPRLNVSQSQLEELATETVLKGMTVPGVQKKLSLHLSQDNTLHRLTVIDYPSGYILKPQSEDFAALPEFEDLAMRLAGITGIKTVPFGLIRTGSDYSYITRRIDRCFHDGEVQLLAMEDFCQLGLRLTMDKYRSSYERCVKIIRKYSAMEKLDLSELLIRVVFSFVIGNSDMHLKNFSLIEDRPGSRKFTLSAAYDILPVNLIMPEDKEELALPLNGKKQNLTRNDFLLLAELCLLPKRSGEKIIDRICSLENKYMEEIERSYLSEDNKDAFRNLIRRRIQRLQKPNQDEI